MPIPKPRKDETQKDFISRCMGDDIMNREYPDGSQRSAICHSQWDNKNKTEMSDEEILVASKEEKGLTIQTLIFEKKYFPSRQSVISWAKSHKFKYNTVCEITNSWRLRQLPPEDFRDIGVTTELDTGVKAVMGHLK